MDELLKAGAAIADITPKDSQFLYGYPHVERYSTGVHDPLLSSALYLASGRTGVLFVANDIVYVAKDMVARVRRRIHQACGIAPNHIMVTATHTHSGPIVAKAISNESDPAVPDEDPRYLQFLEDGIVNAGVRACGVAEPARIGLAVADGRGLGTNRRDPGGAADPDVPVLMVRAADGRRNLACMLVCSMHPTVLHEDSSLVSADFPGMARRDIQERELGADCPILHQTGPCGNQSPRHVVQGNTFSEARRLGSLLGRAVTGAIERIEYIRSAPLCVSQTFLELPCKAFPSPEGAERNLAAVRARLRSLRCRGAPRAEIRTAACDVFGAEETLTLARAARDGRLEEACRSVMPAEIQVVRVGSWSFVGWQGEIFVEYALAVKQTCSNTFPISCANGTLHGYIVTPEAAAEAGYEASNSLFDQQSGQRLVDSTVELLGRGP